MINSLNIFEDIEEENATQLARKNYVQPLNAKWVIDQSNGDSNISANTDFMVDLQPSGPSTMLSWTILSPIDLGGTLQIDLKFNKVQNVKVYT